MSGSWWLILGFLLRTLFRPFALELARAWYNLTFRLVSVGVGREARSLWEDEVFGDLELEIWEGIKDPKLSVQDIAVRVLQRSIDLLWDGWAQRAAHMADAESARAALAQREDEPAGRGATPKTVAPDFILGVLVQQMHKVPSAVVATISAALSGVVLSVLAIERVVLAPTAAGAVLAMILGLVAGVGAGVAGVIWERLVRAAATRRRRGSLSWLPYDWPYRERARRWH